MASYRLLVLLALLFLPGISPSSSTYVQGAGSIVQETVAGETDDPFALVKERLVNDIASLPLILSGNRQTEPALAINPAKAGPNYNIIVGYNNASGPLASQTIGVGISYSTDGGDTWTSFPIPSAGLAQPVCCDPVVAFQSNGTAYMVAQTVETVQVFVTKSVPDASGDAGAVWSNPVVANRTQGNDRPAIAIDNIVNRDPATTPTEYIYVAFQNRNDGAGNCEYVSRSTDAGQTWATAKRLCGLTGSATGYRNDLAIGPSGEVYVVWQNNPSGASGTHTICKLNSAEDWPNFTCASPATLAWSRFPLQTGVCITSSSARGSIPNTCFRTNNQPKLTVDRDNNLYLVWQTFGPGATKATGDGDILMSKAADGNINAWSAPTQVNNDSVQNTNDAVDQFFPDVAFDPESGDLVAVFYDRRDDVSRKNFNLYWARSTDGGASFPENGRITAKSSDPRVSNATGFLGDYIGGDVVAVPGVSGVFAAVWTDLRDGLTGGVVGLCPPGPFGPLLCDFIPYPADYNSNIYFALIAPQNIIIRPWQLEPFRWIGIAGVAGAVPLHLNIPIPVTGINVNDTVSLTVQNLPQGVEAVLKPSQGIPPFTTVLNLQSTTLLQGGDYDLSIVAVDEKGRKSTAMLTFRIALEPFILPDQLAVDPGQSLAFAGMGFAPQSSVVISLDQKPLATVASNSEGDISDIITVPPVGPGSHTLQANDQSGHITSTIFSTPLPLLPDDEKTEAVGIKVGKFFTDANLNPLPTDSFGNPKVDVVLANGVVRSTNPGQVIAWVNVTNAGAGSIQSLSVNETLPVDWTVHPTWLPPKGAIHIFFAINPTSLPPSLEITDPTTITVSTGNPETVSLAIPDLNATAVGHPLLTGQSILLAVKLDYALAGTSQSAGSYPRNYTDTASAAAWTMTSYTGTESTGNTSAFFVAYAKVVGDADGDLDVDVDDLVSVYLHQFTRSSRYDMDFDGDVDIDDLTLTWHLQFT